MATRKDREKAKRKRVDPKEWSKQQRGGEGGSCVKLPDGVEPFKLTPGTHKVDFLPYIVGEGNPRCDAGMEHYERRYEVHWIPTPNGNRSYACRKACFGKRCAVCDFLQTKGGTADPKLVKDMRAKTRHLWIVNDKPGETKKPKIKIFDSNHQNKGMGFAELMGDALDLLDEGVYPFSLEGGYTALMKVSEQSMGDGKKYNAVTRIDLRPHSYDYSADLIDDLPCLDDLLVDPGYDDVKKMLDPEGAEDDDDDKPVSSKPAKGKPAKGKPAADDDDEDDSDDDDDEDDSDDDKPTKGKGGKEKTATDLKLKVGDMVEHEDYGECEILHISKDGTSLKLETEKGKVYPGVSPEDVTKVKTADDDDDDEDDEAPTTAKKGGTGKPVADEEEDEPEDEDDDSDDEDDEEEDDEEPVKPTKGKGKK